MTRTIHVAGDDKVSNRLRRIASRARNVEPALAKVPAILERHVDQTFESDGAMIGRPWRMLSTPYAARKRLMTTKGTLELSGGLRDSFTGGKWHVRAMTPTSLRWETRHPLGHLHHDGSKGKKVPARPILIVTQDLSREVRDELRSHILRGQVAPLRSDGVSGGS